MLLYGTSTLRNYKVYRSITLRIYFSNRSITLRTFYFTNLLLYETITLLICYPSRSKDLLCRALGIYVEQDLKSTKCLSVSITPYICDMRFMVYHPSAVEPRHFYESLGRGTSTFLWFLGDVLFRATSAKDLLCRALGLLGYFTDLLLYESITLRNYYFTDLLLYGSITLRIYYFTNLLLYETITLLICYFTDLLLYESITLRIYYFTNLLLYETITLLICFFEHF